MGFTCEPAQCRAGRASPPRAWQLPLCASRLEKSSGPKRNSSLCWSGMCHNMSYSGIVCRNETNLCHLHSHLLKEEGTNVEIQRLQVLVNVFNYLRSLASGWRGWSSLTSLLTCVSGFVHWRLFVSLNPRDVDIHLYFLPVNSSMQAANLSISFQLYGWPIKHWMKHLISLHYILNLINRKGITQILSGHLEEQCSLAQRMAL